MSGLPPLPPSPSGHVFRPMFTLFCKHSLRVINARVEDRCGAQES